MKTIGFAATSLLLASTVLGACSSDSDTDNPAGLIEVTASGEQLATTDPILASTLGDPALEPGLTLSVDAQRAYVNAAADGVVHEIDYADGARVARSLRTATRPVHVAETGR